MKRIIEKTLAIASTSTSNTSSTIDCDAIDNLSIQCVVDTTVPSAGEFTTPVNEVQTVTFPAKAGATHGDYVVVEDTSAGKWAVALSTGGIAEVTDIDCIADVAASLDGQYFILQDVNGSVAFWMDFDDSGTSEPVHGADRSVEVTTLATGDSAATIAGKLETAIHADSKFTASSSGITVTVTNVDLKDLTDATAGDSGFTVTTTTQGADLGAEPTGAIWAAIPSAKKTQADISGATDAASVAAIAELAFDGLTNFSMVIATDDSAADGTMTFTQDQYGAATDPVVKNADDSGAGSISGVETTAGADDDVDVTANSVTVALTGAITGLKGQLTTTGTLPAGLATSTDYYLIVVDANNVKFASTYALAVAGTAIDITDEGTGVHTFTPTALGLTVKLQKSNDNVNWTDYASTTSITGDGSTWLEDDAVSYRYARLVYTLTAGSFSANSHILGKGY